MISESAAFQISPARSARWSGALQVLDAVRLAQHPRRMLGASSGADRFTVPA